jgi:hypothetical protein
MARSGGKRKQRFGSQNSFMVANFALNNYKVSASAQDKSLGGNPSPKYRLKIINF